MTIQSQILSNEWLEVETAHPDEYRGSRFDRTGIVKQVKLKQGNHTFCVAEKPGGLRNGGVGICNEFGIFEAFGYGETPVGGQFPKIGVGLLRKRTEEPYVFSEAYDREPFGIDVHAGEGSIEYRVEPLECLGYEFVLEKRLSIENRALRIACKLANTGSKPIRTHEYAHNFLAVDGCPIGPPYRLTFSEPLFSHIETLGEAQREMRISPASVHWPKVPLHEYYFRPPAFQAPRPVSWELVHEPSGAGLRESGDFPVSIIAVWGNRYVVSPELFVGLSILPGETRQWTRTYEFFTAE